MASKKVCERCGTMLNEEAKFCPECGNQVSGGANDGFKTLSPCPNCGHPMAVDQQNPSVIKCPACGATQVNIAKYEARLQKEEDEQKKRIFRKKCRKFCGASTSLGVVSTIIWVFVFHKSGDYELFVIFGTIAIMIGIVAGMMGIPGVIPDKYENNNDI